MYLEDFMPALIWIGSAIIIVGLVALGIFSFINATHVDHVSNCVVTEKDRTKDSDGNSDARVYTDNCGVFNVGDSLFEGHWSSADTYSSIKVDETYDFKTRGYRVPFLSYFPNIVEVEKSDG